MIFSSVRVPQNQPLEFIPGLLYKCWQNLYTLSLQLSARDCRQLYLRLLFKAVVDKKRQQEKLTAHVEGLKAVLPFVGFYETVFPTNQMKMAIAQMYTKVLAFLEEALLYYRSGRLHKLIDALVQSQEERLEFLVGDISAEAARLRSLAEAGHVAQQADMKDLMATLVLMYAS